MNTYIVTGTTRGIGRALAEAILAGGDQLLALSRLPDRSDGRWVNVQCELSRSETVIPCLERLLVPGFHLSSDNLVLINNAGVLAPMSSLGRMQEDQISYHMQVNQMAPVLLMSAFIRLSREFSGKRRIINISSGAARHPYSGWSLYCASKAALEMVTLCAAREQEVEVNPVGICAVSPGKVDTDMQVMIRQSSPEQFPAQPQFLRAKASGELMTPEQVACLLLALDKAGQFKNGGIYDLRNAIDHNGMLGISPLKGYADINGKT